MDFKKKAGLALALAAIFTTGGANLALADNITTIAPDGKLTAAVDMVGDGTATINTDTLTVTNAGATAINVNGKSLAVDGLALDGQKEVKSLTVTGDATIAGNGDSLVSSNGKAVDTVTITGALALGTDGTKASAGGSLTNLTVTGATSIQGGAFDITNKLTVGGNITVGDSADTVSAGLNVANLDLAGHVLFADPAFSTDPAFVNIDNFFMADVTNGTINGKLISGQNAGITVGDDSSAWMKGLMDDIENTTANSTTTGAKHWFGWADSTNSNPDLTAAFGIRGSQKLLSTTGAIDVDGSLLAASNPTVNTVNFDKNSLFAIDLTGVSDGTGNGGSSVLSSVDASGAKVAMGNITIGDGVVAGEESVIYVDNARAAGKYVIFESVEGNVSFGGIGAIGDVANGTTEVLDSTKMGAHWSGDNLIFSSRLLDGTWSMVDAGAAATETDNLVLNVGRSDVKVQTIYPMMSNGMAGMVDALYGTDTVAGENRVAWFTSNGNTSVEDGETDNAGILFVSRVTNDNIIGEKDASLAAATLEGAAQIAVAAGVPAVTNNVITRISSLIVDHNNLLNETQPAYGNEPGKLGIWVNPFYATSDVDGMDAGRFESGYEMNYGGAAFGIDYNVNEAFRLGLAMNVGGGDTESNGDFNKTEADFDFFGVSLYGSYTNGAFGLTGDVGFTGVDSEIDQNVPASMLTGNLESNVDSDAFTVGLTGQYRFAASDNFNITPHLGLRYTKISVDDANVDLVSGGRVFDVTTEDQNLFQTPI